jgi:hypothetical protein
METSSATEAGSRTGPTLGEALAVVVPASLWFGLVTGLSEVVLRYLRRQFMGRFSLVGEQVLWMAPLADLIIFGTLGVVFYALIRWRQDARLARLAVMLFAFLAGLARKTSVGNGAGAVISTSGYPGWPASRQISDVVREHGRAKREEV